MACEVLYPICPPLGDLTPPDRFYDTTAATGGGIETAVLLFAAFLVVGLLCIGLGKLRRRSASE